MFDIFDFYMDMKNYNVPSDNEWETRVTMPFVPMISNLKSEDMLQKQYNNIAKEILIANSKNKNSINYAINEKYISDVVEKLEMMGYEVAISNETILKIKW